MSKTLEQIKNEVVQNNGQSFDNWHHFITCWELYPEYKHLLDEFISEAVTEYAAQCCDELQNKDFGFGSYCNVEHKRYVGSNEFFCYKVIGLIKSNTWVNVPVDARVNKAVSHDTMEDVVTCICMGVSEDTVTRFKLSDVIQSNTPNVVKP